MDTMTSHFNDRENAASPVSSKIESFLLEEIKKFKDIKDETISGSLDRMSPALTPIEPLETSGNEVIEIYDGNDNDTGYGNNEQNDSSSVLLHRNYSQSQEYETVEHSSANQISARKNGSLLYRIQNDLGGDNLRQHLNDSKLQKVKAMKLKELELLQKQTQLIELEKQQQIDSFKLKNIEEIMREQEALQKQFKPDTKKTKLPEYLVESWGHYAIIQSKRKMSKSGRLPMIPHQDLPLAKYLKNNKNVRPTRLFLRDLKKSHIKLPGNNQPEGHSQHQQQQQQIQYDARQTHQRHNQYQQRNQQPQQQQQHYEASYQQHHPRQHNGDHYRSPNKYSTSSYHNHNQNSHYNNSHYQYTSPSKSSDTMTTQVHYSNEAEDPFAPTPIQYGEQNVYSYSNSNYNQSTTSNTDSHGWNNTTYQTNSNTQPLGRYNYSLYQPIAPNNAQTQSQPYVNQTSQTWASYRAQAEQHFQMEEQKRQQETKRLEEERRQREQRRLQEQQIQIHQRRLHEIQLQQERMLEEKSRLEQQKQQRFLQQNQQALQKPQLNQASNDNIDPIPQKSLPQLKPQPLTKPPDRLFQRSSPLTSKNGNNKHISNLNNETPEKGMFVFLSFKIRFEYFDLHLFMYHANRYSCFGTKTKWF